MDVYIIMGDPNTKKSATVRALTGIYNKNVWEIETVGGSAFRMFIQVSSLQESGILPGDFVTSIGSISGITAVLVTLWIDRNPYNGCPDGRTYISQFLGAGWTIREIVVLGRGSLPYSLPAGSPPPLHISNISRPANAIAHDIRNRWEWL